MRRKVRAVTRLPPPENKQELLRIMEMIQYLAKFMPKLSDICAPLRTLLKGDEEKL